MKDNHIKKIANYKIIEPIREVTEGMLYKAVEGSSKSSVLIMVYFPSLEWSDATLVEFFDRMNYLRFIEHQYLLPILDIGKYKNRPYIVYPWYFFSFLDDNVSFGSDEKEVVNLFHKIAEAMDYLHRQEILHGALNTENIIIDSEGNPKLFDYGLNAVFKKLLSENMEDSFINICVSNVRCASPEQLLGHNPTRFSDIYSFGTIFYYRVFGKYLFDGKLTPEIAILHLSQEIISINYAPKNIPKNILQFIQKCIQSDPESRFANFAEILRVLERMKKGRGTHFIINNRFLVEVPRKQSGRIWSYIGSILLFVGLFSWFYLNTLNPSTRIETPQTMTGIVNLESITSILKGTETPSTIPSEKQIEQIPSTVEPTMQSTLSQIIYKPAFEGEIPDLPTQTISLLNLEQIEEISRLGYGKPEDVDISADSKNYALATSAGVFIYYGNQLKWIDPQRWATSVEFSPNGDVLAIGLDSGEIQLWDWVNDIKITTLLGHSAKISRILFSNNDLFLYSASFDQHIIVWNLKSQTSVQDIPAHSDQINDIAVSNDGRTLFSCSDDQLIRVWDLATGNKIYEIPFSGKVNAVAISLDDIYLAAGGESGYIRQWNIKTRELRTDPIPVKERLWSLQYIENDSKLLAGIDDGESRIYNAAQMTYSGTSRNFQIDPNPKSLIEIFGSGFEFGSYTVSDGTGNNIISIRWDGELVRNPGGQILKPYYDNLDRLDFSKDGTILAAGGKRGTTSVWEIKSNRIIYQDNVELPFGDPISPDGLSIVVATQSIYQSVSFSNTTIKRSFSDSIPDGIVSYADDGDIFISSSLNQSKVWDYESGFETFFTGYSNNGCYSTVSANNGNILNINSAAGVFQTWDQKVMNICSKSILYKQSLSAFSRDLNLLVYQNTNRLIEGFDPLLKQVLWRYKPDSKITALAVSPDGFIVAIGNEAGLMLFIDGKNGELLSDKVGNFGALQAIEFSEDGKYIATTGSDGITRLFGVVDIKQ